MFDLLQMLRKQQKTKFPLCDH